MLRQQWRSRSSILTLESLGLKEKCFCQFLVVSLLMELQAEVWSDLPDTLWQVILSLLPLPSLAKFRAVCKSWNKLICSSSFALKCRCPVDFGKGVPVLSPARGLRGTVYRCLEGAISKGAERSGSGGWEKFSLGAGVYNARYLVACDGGLMLFDTDHPDRYIVCNPLTKTCREVEHPDISHSSSSRRVAGGRDVLARISGLVVDRETGDYKLVLICVGRESEEGRSTWVYSSATRAWKKGTPITRPLGAYKGDLATYETFFSPGAVTSRGSLYCVLATYEFQQRDDWLWKVAKYNVDRDTWTYTTTLHGRTILFAESTRCGLPTALPDIQLVSVGDKIVIVSKVRTSIWLPRHHTRSIYYNSFAILVEHMMVMEVLGHDLPRTVIRKLLQEQHGGPYSGLPCTFAGYDGRIFFTHQHETYCNQEEAEVEGDTRIVRVGVFGVDDPESHNFLPDFFARFRPVFGPRQLRQQNENLVAATVSSMFCVTRYPKVRPYSRMFTATSGVLSLRY